MGCFWRFLPLAAGIISLFVVGILGVVLSVNLIPSDSSFNPANIIGVLALVVSVAVFFAVKKWVGNRP